MTKTNTSRKSSAVTLLEASVSELTTDTFSLEDLPQEVSREQYMKMMEYKRRTEQPQPSARGIGRMLNRSGSDSRPKGITGKNNRNVVAPDTSSVNSGVISTANDTVKMSNISDTKSEDKKDKKRWGKMKRIIGGAKKADDTGGIGKGEGGNRRQRALTEDLQNKTPITQNGRSASEKHMSSSAISREQREKLDDSIRGRFYGIEVFSLGGSQFTVPKKSGKKDRAQPWELPFECTFTGQSPHWSKSDIVAELLWSSGGRDPPEIILEGIMPGPDGRWSVRIEEPRPSDMEQSKKGPVGRWWNFENSPDKSVQTCCYEMDDGRHQLIQTHELRGLLWGSNPVPADVVSMDQSNSTVSLTESSEDPMAILAARCSIPIDIDDDSFLISTREHIQAMHDIAGLALARGKFDVALRVFMTLYHSLDNVTDNDMRFVKGATKHNIGILQLWMQLHEAAVKSFQEALVERIKELPANHPDIVVSAICQATACFAFGRLDGATTALEKTLPMIPSDHTIRAKVLNNMGVIKYFQGNRKGAVDEFTMALEIQRQWLDGPVIRDTIVYDVSVTLSNMGKLYMERGDFDLSLVLYEEALLLQTKIFRKDHNLILTSLTSFAMVKANNIELETALLVLDGCLRTQNARYGTMSAASVEIVGLSGFLCARKGDFNNAVKAIYSVRKWQKANLPDNHPALTKSKQCLKAIEAKLGAKEDSVGTRLLI